MKNQKIKIPNFLLRVKIAEIGVRAEYGRSWIQVLEERGDLIFFKTGTGKKTLYGSGVQSAWPDSIRLYSDWDTAEYNFKLLEGERE